jgi:hypothetical protein
MLNAGAQIPRRKNQDKLLELFAKYASLFDGTLGKNSNLNIHLESKPNSNP